jgi:hypothetical protein
MAPPKVRVRRTRGRRASDRRPNLESVLAAVTLIAWGWCAFEIIRVFVR